MNETKKIFKEPEIEIIMIQSMDIITASDEEEEKKYNKLKLTSTKLTSFGIFN